MTDEGDGKYMIGFGVGEYMPELGEEALPHWDLAKKYNIIDFDLGVKITGAGFPVYIGKGARLQRALIQFFLDEAGKAGYVEVQPPYVVNEASGYGTGQLPDKEGQMYHCGLDNLYLIPLCLFYVIIFCKEKTASGPSFSINFRPVKKSKNSFFILLFLISGSAMIFTLSVSSKYRSPSRKIHSFSLS